MIDNIIKNAMKVIPPEQAIQMGADYLKELVKDAEKNRKAQAESMKKQQEQEEKKQEKINKLIDELDELLRS